MYGIINSRKTISRNLNALLIWTCPSYLKFVILKSMEIEHITRKILSRFNESHIKT